jgi:oligoendopeptidase F
MRSRRISPAVAGAFALSLASLSAHAASKTSNPPASPPSAATAGPSWDLRDLYPTEGAWDEAYARARKGADDLESFRGTLDASASSMLKALSAISDSHREAKRLLAYAALKSDEDLRIGSNLARKQQAQALLTRIGEKTSWVAPEILEIGAAKVQGFRAENRTLDQRFGFYLGDTLRSEAHTLGPEAEGVLAAAGLVLAQPSNIHGVLSDAEFPAPTVKLADGTSVRLDEPAYEKYRQAPNREDRKTVFDAYWNVWKSLEGTTGSLLAAQVMGSRFAAQSHKFADDLAAAQFEDNMPESVYTRLVEQTNAALPTLHRYLRLRKRLLGIQDDMRYYDNYPAMYTPAHKPRFSVEESERLTLAALAPLGEDYLGLMRKGFSSRWMNPYPHEGKASGAYMNPIAYDVHPYLLLNLDDDYEALSVLAHEWGHAVHTMLANRAQPFETSRYSTFIAESASIGNEMLVNDYMIARASDREQKLFYIGQGLESIRGTYFRQVMFAEFEFAIHKELEEGHPLSGQRMTEMYCGLLRKYYGEAEGVMKIDPSYCLEWAFVPHFYYNFYVYQYATSMAGAAFFTDAIVKEGAPARDRFLTLLRAGGSDYPYDLYKRAGVDMATAGPYRAVEARMNRLLDEFEALEAKKK